MPNPGTPFWKAALLVLAAAAVPQFAAAADPFTDLAKLGVQSVCSRLPDFQLTTDLCSDLVTVAEADRNVAALFEHYQGMLVELDGLGAGIAELPDPAAAPAESIRALDALEAESAAAAGTLYGMVERLSEEIERRRFLLANADLLGRHGDLLPSATGPAIALLVGDPARLQEWIAFQDQMVDSLVALQEFRITVAEVRSNILPEGSFNGVWGSTYGSEMVLRVEGDRVTGSYGEDNGRVFFTIAGPRTLAGYWVEDGSARNCGSEKDGSPHWGRLVLVFDESFNGYGGSWSYCENEVSGSTSEWVGDFLRPLGE